MPLPTEYCRKGAPDAPRPADTAMSKCILVINPGSTSTKIAVFRGAEKVFDETLRHSREELAPFHWVMEQVDFRRAVIERALAAHDFDTAQLDGICARGGQLPPCESGTYLVEQRMVDYMYTIKHAAHASNLGCVLALELAQPLHIPAFICDPVSVDEMTEEARITGLPEIRRTMLGHALNCRAMARRCAEEVLHKPLEDCRLIVLHLGGGASARLPDAEHRVRPLRRQRVPQDRAAADKLGRHFQFT